MAFAFRRVTHTGRKAGAPGEARVTIRSMVRACALLAVALSFISCGDGGSTAASAESVERAQAEAEAAATLAEDLRQQVDDLTAQIEAAETDTGDLGDRLDRSAAKLTKALDRLRERLGSNKDSIDSAAAQASAAAAEVAAAIRRLSVLEDRFDYHLKRYHGGG